MSETENSSLSLEEVVSRFADSEHALSRAREALEELAGIEKTQAAAAKGLEDAAASFRALVETATQLMAESTETQKLARNVLEAGAALIDGTEMREVQDGLGEIGVVLKDGLARIEQLVDQVRERDEKIAELQSELDRYSGVLSGRQRKKLGLG